MAEMFSFQILKALITSERLIVKFTSVNGILQVLNFKENYIRFALPNSLGPLYSPLTKIALIGEKI